MKRLIFVILILVTVPIIVNYGLFTWRAPFVYGDSNAWLSFMGSYLGLLGAMSIAVIQFRAQKTREENKDKMDSRSFVVVNDINAPLNLINVKTSENSRIIETPGYIKLLNPTPKPKYSPIRLSYLMITHYGNSEVIFNCNILFSAKNENRGDTSEVTEISLGVVEKGVEVYIPLVKPEDQEGDVIKLDYVKVKYSTLKRERMELTHDFNNKQEKLTLINEDGSEEVIYSNELLSVNWIYPNKIIKPENKVAK